MASSGRRGVQWLQVGVGVVVVGVAALVGARSRRRDPHVLALAASLRRGTGGWHGDSEPYELVRSLRFPWCDFAVENASLSSREFEARYRSRKRPVLVRGGLAEDRERWTKARVRSLDASTQYGAGSDVVYAGGGTTNHATLAALVDHLERDAPDDVFAFDTNNFRARDVKTPAFASKAFDRKERASAYDQGYRWPVLSVGPSRSGLPTHTHGETWLGVAHGAKRWLVAAPGRGLDPDFLRAVHPVAASSALFAAVDRDDRNRGDALGCLQRAGDVVYLPAGWKHATLNVGETIAVGEQYAYGARDRYPQTLETLEASPRDVEALHGAAVSAAHLGFDAKDDRYLRRAVGFLRRAVVERPLQPEVNIILAEILHALGDLKGAVRVVDECRRLYAATADRPKLLGEPNDVALAAVHLKFARFFLGIESWQNALPPLADALRLRPGYAQAFKDRAVAYEHLARPDLALRDLETAHDLDPSDPETQDNLHRLLVRTKEVKQG